MPFTRGERRTTREPALDGRFAVPLRGISVDRDTRCAHYDGPADRVALRFDCCDAFYPCHRCHEEAAAHPARPWPRARFNEPAVLCGACRTALTATAYLDSGHRCPACAADFNPGCAAHYGLYFEGF